MTVAEAFFFSMSPLSLPLSKYSFPILKISSWCPKRCFYPLPIMSSTGTTLPLSISSSSPAPVKVQKKKTKKSARIDFQNVALFSEGRDTDAGRLVCPGCGVFMQDLNLDLPGYYQKRAVPKECSDIEDDETFESFSLSSKSDDDEEEALDFDDDGVFSDLEQVKAGDGDGKGLDWNSDWDVEEEEDARRKELDGFSPAGVGYGNVTEEIVESRKREKISKSERKKKSREAEREEYDGATVCARCHSLRYYGQVKNTKLENLIPDFDFERLVTSTLLKPSSTSPVVVIVVDCVDFDGSFPKRAAKSLFKTLDSIKKESKLTKFPKLILVGTKTDLLPSQISPTRLDRWVRNRAKANGAPRLTAVYLVSARKDVGIRNLLAFIKEQSGPRGNVWVIGAQNAGKSTLINAFAKRSCVKITRLTEAAIPGTTLGILRIGGILPAKAKMYDTPGLLHPNLMSMRLNREEQKMIEIRKELRPRTYRVKAGQTVHVGGLARVDVVEASVQTIYITVCASPNVSLHLGKTENADDIWNKHVGVRLQPPFGEERSEELGVWKPRKIKVSGISWDVNSVDIAVSGLGWFSLGLKGNAMLTLWTYDGVDVVTQREPLVLDRASFLERPGFLLPKSISEALGNQCKADAAVRKRSLED